jgi:hypothetical protein
MDNIKKYKCELCLMNFKSKQGLDKHISKKIRCDNKTDYKCEKCNKYFNNASNLTRHLKINKCIKLESYEHISENEYIDSNLLKIMDINISIDSKIDLLKTTFDIKLNKNTIKEILNNNDINMIEKIKLFKITNKDSNIDNTISTINNGTINTNNTNNTNTENSHNVTNNIQINSFGKEDISYLDNEYFKNLIMNQHIEKGYVQLIKDIYLNKAHPENGTVKVENINNKYALVYKNGKWDTILKADLKEQIHKKNYTVLKMHYDKLSKSMSIPKREETRTFLARDDSGDPHMMYVIDKIILLFYNGEYEEVLEKDKINKNI